MIAKLQLPSFNRSTRSSGARKLTNNFYWFSQHAVLRQVHRSERLTTLAAGAVWSASAPIRSEIDVSSILFRELVLLLVPPDGHCDLQL